MEVIKMENYSYIKDMLYALQNLNHFENSVEKIFNAYIENPDLSNIYDYLLNGIYKALHLDPEDEHLRDTVYDAIFSLITNTKYAIQEDDYTFILNNYDDFIEYFTS